LTPGLGAPTTDELPGRCVVYGAGGFGRSLVGELRAAGVDVVASFDSIVTDPDGDPPVCHPLERPDLRALPVILGVCNPQVDPREIADLLLLLGHTEIWSPVDAFAALGRAGRQREHYWLTWDADLYARDSEQVSLAREQLADARSIALFSALLEYRTRGRIKALPDIDPSSLHYRPADLDFIDGPISLVDGGAFDGDTIRAYFEAGTAVESVLAFEPDPDNFRRLAHELARHGSIRGMALPLALGRRTEPLRFASDGTSGAAIDEEGATVVQCVALDDALHGWTPTHVKLDLEGSEPDALGGMERLLHAARPRLAISAYHRPDHLWTLLLQLAALDLGYRFHLRCYGEQCFDTVLYAIPEQ
jgi:FkbM family methyltransferase